VKQLRQMVGRFDGAELRLPLLLLLKILKPANAFKE
jgi:hypothetical protein